MAENTDSNITGYVIALPATYSNLLASVRHWDNIKIARSEDSIYIKELTSEQVNDPVFLTIPQAKLYELHNQLLFTKDSNVPLMRMPAGLLFTPIDRAFPVKLPKQNFNFFGVREKIPVNLVNDTEEKKAAALLTSVNLLESYTQVNSAVRLQGLQWALFNHSALITGYPLLPLPGKAYWQAGNSFLPLGYNFELPLLQHSIEEKLNSSGSYFILWEPTGNYVLIEKILFTTLTLASVRKSKSTA